MTMQPIRNIEHTLRALVTPDVSLFALSDLASILPEHDRDSLRHIVARAVESGILVRACRGIYMLATTMPTGLELYHIAAKFRAGYFNYISQETALSEAGVISQIPIGRLTIMSSGSSGILRCGSFGTVEFTHTKRCLEDIAPKLVYDDRCHLLRAPVDIAWEDLRAARRNIHLVDREALNELVR